MKCSRCNNHEANTHITRIINGKKEEMHLCEECAREMRVNEEFDFEPFSFNNFFGNLLGAGVSALNSLAGIERCTSCGSSFNDIVKSGKVGCADCYSKFEDRLSPNIEKIHGKAKHIGKLVTYTVDDDTKQDSEPKLSPIDELKAELKNAIKDQRFEDAAVIRDKIKSMTEEA